MSAARIERLASRFGFSATLIEWRGPAPHVFAPVPVEHAAAMRQAARIASYGWGVVPVEAVIRGVRFGTSLFPKDGTYLLPIKLDVRRRAGLTVGDSVEVQLTVRPGGPRL